jgi:hypothetical protein
MKTKSENMFEQFCKELSIEFTRVPESNEKYVKRPDYEVVINSTKILVEVKQIDPNQEEKENQNKLANGEMVTSSLKPGDRIRKKIHEANPQLRELLNGRKIPCILVVLNNTYHDQHTERYSISIAMQGFDTIDIVIPKNPEKNIIIGNVYSGKDKAMRSDVNTTISAIAIFNTFKDPFCLDIYHNRFAKIPINPDILKIDRIQQFELKENAQNSLNDPWQLIS